MTFNLLECDAHISFCRDQAKRLRVEHGHKSWAQQQADKFEAMERFLLEVRREFQMRGPTGARIDGG